MPPVGYGVIALVSWGVSDWLVASPSRRVGVVVTAFWTQLVGLVLLTPIAIAAGGWTVRGSMLAFASGIITTAGYLSFYAALRSGLTALVSPISAGWAAITAVLSVIYLSESLSPGQWLAIAVILVGSGVSGIESSHPASPQQVAIGSRRRAAVFATLAAICWGIGFTVLAGASRRMGWAAAVAVVKLVVVAIAGCALLRSATEKRPESMRRELGAAGALDAIAWVAYSLGAAERAAVVAPVAAGYPAVTAVLALTVGGERPRRYQYVGVVCVIAGLLALRFVGS